MPDFRRQFAADRPATQEVGRKILLDEMEKVIWEVGTEAIARREANLPSTGAHQIAVLLVALLLTITGEATEG